jgi:signal transduction histidine kinase
MKRLVRFPIRLKVMIALLFGITAVVSVIVFTMAHFFHEDKRSYLKDWISIATRSTAAECRSLLDGYVEQLELAALLILDEELDDEQKAELVQHVFDNLPELIEIDLYHEGELIDSAADAADLEAAGLSGEDILASRRARPLPLDRVLAGQIHVRNSTIARSLPSFTLAFRLPVAQEPEPVVVSAVLRPDALVGLASKFQVFEVVLVDEDGILLAHPDLRRVAARYPANLHPAALEAGGANRAAVAIEYNDQGTTMLGAFADVEVGGVTAAAQIPAAAARLASRELLGRLLLIALGLLVLMAVVGRIWARRIVRPVERLSAASREIGRGRFDIQVDVESRDEIGELATSFNRMATELKTRDEELEQAQAQLIQSEKMAAFGQLGAGIAHEVKNPLAGILGCAQLSLMEVDEGTPLHENLRIIEKETGRCRTIIDNLMKFARQEKTLFEPTEINQVVEDACAIINHQLEIKQVKAIRDLADRLPRVRGSANQLQQVLMNLMINAQQAMDGEPGTVTVSTRLNEDREVEIVVRDDGPGIPEEIRDKLFEPFFTTKPTGEGTGLGLSVSFGIVQDHKGEIEVESEVGEGTAFVIRIPVEEAAMEHEATVEREVPVAG